MYVNSQQQIFITRSSMIFSADSPVIYVNNCRGQVSILVIKLFVLITLPNLLTACHAGTMITSEANKAQDFNLANNLVR